MNCMRGGCSEHCMWKGLQPPLYKALCTEEGVECGGGCTSLGKSGGWASAAGESARRRRRIPRRAAAAVSSLTERGKCPVFPSSILVHPVDPTEVRVAKSSLNRVTDHRRLAL